MPVNRGKVMVGLSGGVDSSVAALRLLEQGWDVEGLFMKNWEEDDDAAYCGAAEDLADASAVADLLGIRLHTINLSLIHISEPTRPMKESRMPASA